MAASTPLVSILRQTGPGRMRVNVPGLYRCDRLKLALEELPRQQPGILSVQANPLTGHALVLYKPANDAADILDRLDACARALAPASLPAPSSPKRKQANNHKPASKSKEAKPATAKGDGLAPPKALWHATPIEDALNLLGSRPEGLSEAEASQHLTRYGSNLLEQKKGRSSLSIFAGQFMSPPVAMLGISAAISVATGGIADAAVILGVVAINSIIGYITESEAEKTINALGAMTATHAPLLRGGKEQMVPIADIVPGDILVLRPGLHVAADSRLLHSRHLTVDESSLTGESLPVGKDYRLVAAGDTPLGDRRNMLHMGSNVTGGSGLAVVVGTGKHTEIGLIQSLVGEVETPQTPMQKQLDDMGLNLALISSAVCAGVFGLGIVRGQPMLEMLKSSISLAVAAVPEGLPAVATTTLALGIRQMQRRHVLIRQLPAVEGLGSVQTLCLDKTGTLTLNRMSAVCLELPNYSIALRDEGFFVGDSPFQPLEKPEVGRLLQVLCLCSETSFNAGKLEGSPTETALVEIALSAGEDLERMRQSYPLVKTIHRAEERPYMATVHKIAKGRHFVAVKGRPQDVLALCSHWQDGDEIALLDERKRAGILAQNEKMAGSALRVLGMAWRETGEIDSKLVTQELVWLGLAGMEDAMRPGMAELMAQFHEAGIQTVMITGDQSSTAYSVGQRLNLSGDEPLEIIDSASLERLDPEILAEIAKSTSVFARVSPVHKLRIVQSFQKAGRVVAMTGDGVNDGPALKAANIGVAMGNQGTDVARSVSDLVLEDDNLHTMIEAVGQGRTIYRNIRKSLRFLLSTNLSEIEMMLIGTAIGAGEVLNPMQLLWINLLSDIMPGIALAVEPSEKDVLKEKPRDPSEPIIRKQDGAKMLRESLTLTAGAMGVWGLTMARTGPGPAASTNAFMTITLGQLLHSISCRSETTSVFVPEGRKSNPLLTSAVASSILLQVLAVAVPPLRGLLRMTPPGPADWLAIGLGAGLPFVVNEAAKHLPPRGSHGKGRQEDLSEPYRIG